MKRLLTLVLLSGALLGAPAHAAPETSSAGPVADWIQDEIRCLALNMYFEARGEPDAGMLAVGHVVLNRIDDPRFPRTACAVITQGGERVRHRCQFSWYCDGKADTPEDPREWSRAQALARAVFWEVTADPSQGATYYHADYVAPHWMDAFERGPKIGQHIFYIDPDRPREQLASR